MILEIAFADNTLPKDGILLLTVEKSVGLAADAPVKEALDRAIEVAEWKAGFGKVLDIITPAGSAYDRIILLGAGDADDGEADRWARLGGKAFTALGGKDGAVASLAGASVEHVGDFAMGARLAAYKFDRYKTVKKDGDDETSKNATLTIATPDTKASQKAAAYGAALADGMALARDLVNEPANVLTPKNFAKRMKKLAKLGCDVTILGGKDMAKLKMGALLGVSQGSRNPPRMAIIEWNGGKKGDAPVAFVGKGVTFDTGGISIKPASGMEDMKGDMGGAAAVAGVMHALAARKAKANVVGCVALVENMPDGNAQRPGDIVTSMSGQTIEIINTDAEGRLVLADALWHINAEYEPAAMVNLATLTGAILVALGNNYAGMFSNDDGVAASLTAAGEATDEKVWRMPLGAKYDKLIDTKNADMKNTGGRLAGSITAAQFLKRFVKDTPWAHLDVAGTAMNSPTTEISTGWASGFGVRLLDRYVADQFET